MDFTKRVIMFPCYWTFETKEGVAEIIEFLFNPTNLFTILGPHDQEIGEYYVVQERRATDFEAPKLWKGRSGIYNPLFPPIILTPGNC